MDFLASKFRLLTGDILTGTFLQVDIKKLTQGRLVNNGQSKNCHDFRTYHKPCITANIIRLLSNICTVTNGWCKSGNWELDITL